MALAFELRVKGHGTGLACALARRLEDELPFAAFKMAHPLETYASVILGAQSGAEASAACSAACEALAADVNSLLDQLPADPFFKERTWPERSVHQPLEASLHLRDMRHEA